MRITTLLFALNLFLIATQPGLTSERRTFLSEIPSSGGKVKIAFFDADGTLRVSKSGSPAANAPDDFIILPFVPEKIAELNRQGYLVAIVTNQAGVGKFVTMDDVNGALSNMIDELGRHGATVQYFDIAERKDGDRKPGTGMAVRLETLLREKGLEVDWKSSFMAGDAAFTEEQTRPDGTPGFNFTDSDRLFAENLGIAFHEAFLFFGWNRHGAREFNTTEDLERFFERNPELRAPLSYCAALLLGR